MIVIEKFVLSSPEQMKFIIEGARNPMNSWSKSDSYENYTVEYDSDDYDGVVEVRRPYYRVGAADADLMRRLSIAGADHRKFMRMMNVYIRMSAPLYWISELDTYKVGTVRNSCSFMHKGVSKPFEIDDFSVKDERIYKILRPTKKKTYELSYPYETDEYKPYVDHNGKKYRVYRNGYVIREGFEYTDNYGTGRTRHFDDGEATIYQNKEGYFIVKLSGRNGGHMLLHRLVASVWCSKKSDDANQVNHKDGNKGNNSAENLEWVTASENMKHGIETGLYDELGGIRQRYKLWKVGSRVIPASKRMEFKHDCIAGLTYKQLAVKWGITPEQASNIRYAIKNNENEDLFQECYVWDVMIEELNYLRALYLETKDEKIFQSIRCLLPQGYMQTSNYMLNYEVLANIYKSRKNHRLDEWREFCEWVESLPYSELITATEEKEVKKEVTKKKVEVKEVVSDINLEGIDGYIHTFESAAEELRKVDCGELAENKQKIADWLKDYKRLRGGK